ncbi:MAG: ornithine cyclodeaminase family protein [Clostridia bacterium]|nr:ornithine cyclodeaminase family protein [Clostridia bacterium]
MSGYKPEILFLKQEDVIAAGLLDMKMILEATEKTFKMIAEGKVINPSKIQLAMPDEENMQSFCMSMPSYIGGDINVAGFKWASESRFNITQPGMPLGVDLTVLSDPLTVYPKAIMDATLITAMRTSAAAGVAAKYIASKNTKVACLVGAGVIGRTMVSAIMESVPSIEKILLCDLNMAKAEGIAKEYEGKYNVVPCGDTEAAAKQANLIVTMTTATKPFLKAEWVKPNATVIQMAPHEIEEEILLKADKKIIDNWSQLSHITGSIIHKTHVAGKLEEEMCTTLPQLAAGLKPGRESEDELCVCATLGVGAVDIAIAHQLYLNALEKGIGQKLMLWDNPLWV